MSKLSGNEPASPLVAFRNVFPSRGDDLRNSRDFSEQGEDVERIHRVELPVLACYDCLDCFFVNSSSGPIEL